MRSELTRRLAGSLTKLFDGLLELTGTAAGLIFLVIMFSLFYEVVARRLFNRPTIWALDISTLGLFFASLIAAGWILKHEEHVKIEIVLSLFNPRHQAVINSISSIVGLVACLVFVWQGLDVTVAAYKSGVILDRTLEVPKVFYLWAFPFGFSLICIQFVRMIRGFLRDAKSHRLERK